MPTLNGAHLLDARLLGDTVNVVVIGAGGSGSHMVADLAVLDQSMLDLGHPGGLQCTVIDHDSVGRANLGRARFYASDIGANKAQTIVQRVNACYGLEFRAISGEITPESGASQLFEDADVVIGCVDTRESRRSILAALTKARSARRSLRESTYWLDLGNGSDDGQVVLGEVGSPSGGVRLPCVTDLFPEMLDQAKDPKNTGPSCSRAEALTRQSAFVNKTASLQAVTLLSALFRFGRLEHSCVFFNLVSQRTSVLPCTLQAWARFGYKPEVKNAVEAETASRAT